jgi:hypothetical protein
MKIMNAKKPIARKISAATSVSGRFISSTLQTLCLSIENDLKIPDESGGSE